MGHREEGRAEEDETEVEKEVCPATASVPMARQRFAR